MEAKFKLITSNLVDLDLKLVLIHLIDNGMLLEVLIKPLRHQNTPLKLFILTLKIVINRLALSDFEMVFKLG